MRKLWLSVALAVGLVVALPLLFAPHADAASTAPGGTSREAVEANANYAIQQAYDSTSGGLKAVGGGWELIASGTSTATTTENLTAITDVSAYRQLKVEAFFATVTGTTPSVTLALNPYTADSDIMNGLAAGVFPSAACSGPSNGTAIILGQGADMTTISSIGAANSIHVSVMPVPSKVRLVKTLAGTSTASTLRWALYGRK